MAKSSLKSTLAVSLNNYLDAGAIVAGICVFDAAGEGLQQQRGDRRVVA